MKLVSVKHRSSIGRFGLFSCLSLVAMTVASTSLAAPSARVTATRTSGPAPLAVLFDATATTDSNSSVDPFRDLGYRFHFGDSGSGNWATTGLSRNEQIGGPLAAHVFEQPGTYTVQLMVKDASGGTSTASVTITVQSADSVYSGTRTVCLSRNTDFSGCPSGAQQLANVSSWPSFQSNHRYLLRRGQDFTSLGGLRFGAGESGLADAQLGAFGSGEKPRVAAITIVSGNDPSSNWYRRVVIADLDALNIGSDRGGSDLLLLRNSVTRGGMIELAGAYFYYLERASGSGWPPPENTFLVENTVDRNFGTAAAANPNGITGFGTRFVALGNTVDRTSEHNMRLWQVHKAVIAHNRLTGRSASSIRHALKIHSAGLSAPTSVVPVRSAYSLRSSELVIADNQLGSEQANINWLGVTSPQNGESAEGIERTIWEDNQFRHGSNYVSDITWAGRQMIGRGNRNLTANRNASYGVGHANALPADWRGPYYSSDASMKLRFSGNVVVPARPTGLTVQ